MNLNPMLTIGMTAEMNQKFYWKVLETGQTFQNRKEAKEVLGHYYFNRLQKDGKIKMFVSEEK